MRATRYLLNAARKQQKPTPQIQIPVEMYPLFAAVGVAVASGCYFTYRHFAHDRHLRLWKNPDLSNLDEVLNEAQRKELDEAKSATETKDKQIEESKEN